jgi:hypothetical protein
MPVTISGTSGITYPAGGLANTAGAGVGTTDTQTLTNKTITSPTLTTPNIDSAQIATVSGTAPIYPCRAWVNFNGTGTVAIRASGNVSSITDNGTGDYTVNFTNAMPDANYAVNGLTNSPSGLDSFVMEINRTTTQTASLVRIRTFRSTTGVVNDPDIICVSIFR